MMQQDIERLHKLALLEIRQIFQVSYYSFVWKIVTISTVIEHNFPCVDDIADAPCASFKYRGKL